MNSYTSGLTKNPIPPEFLEGKFGKVAFFPFPAEKPWLHLLISHGLSEHAGWYHHLARTFQERGISTYLFDHYHHGQSAGTPGDVPDYSVLVEGFHRALHQGVTPRRSGDAPLAVLAHSNGALVALLALHQLSQDGVDTVDSVAALAFTSPYLGMHPFGAFYGTAVATLLSWINPAFQIRLPTVPERLTNQRAIWPQYLADPLRFNGLSARFFLAMRRALRQAAALSYPPGRPLLVLTAGAEQVVDVPSISRWFARTGARDNSLKTYPGLRHELFHDESWLEIVEEIVDWLAERFQGVDRVRQERSASGDGAEFPVSAVAGK